MVLNPHALPWQHSEPPTPRSLAMVMLLGALLIGAYQGLLIDAVAQMPSLTRAVIMVCSAVMGAVIGTGLGYRFSEWWGRRTVLMGSAMMSMVCASLCLVIHHATVLIAAWSGGAIVGVYVILLPQFAHEFSLPGHRRLMPQTWATVLAGTAGVIIIGALLSQPFPFVWALVLGLSITHLVTVSTLPESPVWLAHHDEVRRAYEASCRLHGSLEASVGFDWVMLDADMHRSQSPLRVRDLRIYQIRHAFVTGCLLICAQEFPLARGVMVISPFLAAEVATRGFSTQAVLIACALLWLFFSLLGRAMLSRSNPKRYVRIVMGVCLGVLGAALVVAGCVGQIGSTARIVCVVLGLTFVVGTQSVLVFPACQGAVDPGIPPWLVTAQRRWSALGHLLSAGISMVVPLVVTVMWGVIPAVWLLLGVSVIAWLIVIVFLPHKISK
ncbi:MFS transporter [Actinomyces vulturis]|uniref:MFS transporter n=1 Tax=Actinomyces vulturis TaxID=1857645 RepID=UPI00083667FB|nr:MFS transporter [Actinomyces vulturis]